MFQIGDINCNSLVKKNIISFLDFGNKFVPNFFFNKNEFFNFLLSDLDNALIEFNTKFTLNIHMRNKVSNNENFLNNFEINNSYLKGLNKFLKEKKALNTEKFYISKEIYNFRLKLIEELIKNRNSIKISPNISHEQLFYLKMFLKENNFKIINCDKNIGNALIDNATYIKEVDSYLRDDNSYTVLDSNPLENTISRINNQIKYLLNNGHLSKKLGDSLILNINYCKLGTFRLLAKLHKSKFSWKPIVNCKNHPTSKISKLLDFLLKPLVQKSETYLKDSQNLIQISENTIFHEKPYFNSLDFESLYSNIDPIHCTNTITEYIANYLNNSNLDLFAFRTFLLILFQNNIFKCNNKYYIQNRGLAMGSICGPTIANLYLYILEIRWVKINKPIMYFRFIDDIFLALHDKLDLKDLQEQFIYLKLNESEGDTVNFLDLNVSFDKVLNN